MDQVDKKEVNKKVDKRTRSLSTTPMQSSNASETHKGSKRAKRDGSEQKTVSKALRKYTSNNNRNNEKEQAHSRHAKAIKRKEPHSIQQRSKGGNQFSSNEERYAVIITNVENDFSKVHEELLQFHCHLDPKHKQSEFTSLPPSLFTEHCEQQEEQESKSLEQNESCMSSKHTAKANTSCDLTEKVECSNADTAVGKEHRKECVYQLKCRNETRSAELTVYGYSPENISSIFVAPSTKAQRSNPNAEQFTSLKKMISKVAHKPYFDHMLKFYMNSPNFAIPLPSVEGNDNNVNTSCNHTDADQTTALTTNEKSVKEIISDKIDDQTNETLNCSQKTETSAEIAQLTQQRQTQKEKFNLRQRDLVTAVAEISVPLSNNELRARFTVLPHFVSSWQIRPRTFRVVFANAQSLFDAKQLLDQFELDGNVRVLLRLSDDLQQRFTSFIAAMDNQR